MGKMAIVGATLIDGTGGKPIPDSVVLVEGSKISAAGRRGEVEIPTDAEVIDAAGRFLLPGLVDLHVHIFHRGFVPLAAKGDEMAYASVVAANNLRSALQAGITTMRSVSDFRHLDLAMRTAVERGILLGPRLFVAGTGLCITGGHGSGMPGVMHEVDGPGEIRKAIRTEVKAGVDLIKMLSSHRTDRPEFSLEEIEAGVDEAHRLGRRLAIHAANLVGTRMAAEAGVDTIEHGSFVDEETAELMAEKGIFLVPTLWVKNHIPESIRMQREEGKASIWNLSGRDLEETETWFSRCVERLPETMRLAKAKGVRIGTGTDNVFPDQPFTMVPEEVEWLTRYGLTSMEAIESATRVGAEAIGAEGDFGTVEPGKYADMIMVDSDPLEDVAALKEVSWVMKEGAVIHLHPEWARRPIQEPLSTG